SANTRGDVEAVIALIKILQEQGVAGDLLIRLVPLEHADATSVANTLTEFFRRVIIGPSGTTLNRVPQVTAALGPRQQITPQQLSSVVLMALPRFNSILVAAPRARLEEILTQIKQFDVPVSPLTTATPFQLQKASASRVAQTLIGFYSTRYFPP